MIFETKPELFSIGIIIVFDEIVSLLSIGVSDIKINEKYDPKQRTSNQRATEVVPSTTKPKDFYVRLEISLEDKFIQKPIIIIVKLILKWMKHQPKYRYKIFR